MILKIKEFATIVKDFTHKASVTSVQAEANSHNADWLMSVFVNEIAHPVFAVIKVSACSSAE